MKLSDFVNKIQNSERKVLPKAVFEPNGERLLREPVDTESVLLLFLFLFLLTIFTNSTNFTYLPFIGLCYCLVYGGFFQQISPQEKPVAVPVVALGHHEHKAFVQSLLEKAEKDVGAKALLEKTEKDVGPKALHPWHYPPVFLVDHSHPSLVDDGQEPHWTENVDNKEDWNGVVFR